MYRKGKPWIAEVYAHGTEVPDSNDYMLSFLGKCSRRRRFTSRPVIGSYYEVTRRKPHVECGKHVNSSPIPDGASAWDLEHDEVFVPSLLMDRTVHIVDTDRYGMVYKANRFTIRA